MVDTQASGHDYGDESVFLRRINFEWVVFDHAEGAWRTSSQAYQPHPVSGRMSMTCCDFFPTHEAALTAVLAGLEGYGVIELSYPELQAAGDLVIHRDPLPHDPGHVLIEGTRKKSKQRALARAARWVINPRAGDSP